MKRIFTTLIFVIPLLGYSNSLELLSTNAAIANEGVDRQSTNQKDANGWKQGWWIVMGKDMPEKGYPTEGKIEEGNYKDDKKTGEWTMYHTDGVTIRTKGNFDNGRPKGEYVKFDESGNKKEEGNYSNGKESGALTTYYPNGQVAQSNTFNAEG